MTHYEFLYHVAAIPLEILLGAFLVKRFLAEKEARRHQLMYIKSFIFRSEMRNLFIANFNALVYPDITIPKIKASSLQELKTMRSSIEGWAGHQSRSLKIQLISPVVWTPA